MDFFVCYSFKLCTYPFVQLPFKVIIIYMIIKKNLFDELPSDPPKKRNVSRLIKKVFEEEKKCVKFVTFQGENF